MNRKIKEEFNIEDAILDSVGKNHEIMEMPLSRKVFLLVSVLLVVSSLISVIKIFWLFSVSGDDYRARSLANVNEEVIIPAYRGLILDRFGEPLAKNQPSFSVFLNLAALLRSPGGREARPGTEVVLEKLASALFLDQRLLNDKVAKFDWKRQSVLVVARGLNADDFFALQRLNLPGVLVKEDHSREYVDAPVFAHVLGYHGQVTTGLEAVYDRWLNGEDGLLINFEDARGEFLDKKIVREPAAGAALITTLDAGLQRYFYKRLFDGLRSLGRDTGVGLAIQPQTGEVLALVSLPSFNNNLFSSNHFREEKSRLLNSPVKPLFNRAVSGQYTPGSTIKPLVALAALREKVITPDLSIFSRGFIEIPNPYHPDQPSRFLDWKPHGWVDLHSALARSSNIYFYAAGGGLPRSEVGLIRSGELTAGLGIEKLREYWQKFLLGSKTGIDLPAENIGFLPDAEDKERRTGEIWRIGDTYNISIGQGDLLLSPLQLINFIASIGNGGRIYRPFLAKEAMKDSGERELINQPTVTFDYSDWQPELREVQSGLADAVSKWYGTANLLSSLPVSAAGKTGSAQVANNTRTNAFFVGYAPAENPQIALLVLIENAREGSLNAVPIAKDVLEWYYYNRIMKNE